MAEGLGRVTRVCLLGLALGLMACSDPRLNAGVSITPEGVSVAPQLYGRIGGVGVAISP